MTPLLLIDFTTRFPSTTITYPAAHLRIGTGSIANFTNRADQSLCMTLVRAMHQKVSKEC
jgi:hypothetical protein